MPNEYANPIATAQLEKEAAKLSLENFAAPGYADMCKIIELSQDCIAGEDAVKSKDDQYIYKPHSKSGTIDEKIKEWNAYKSRGKFPEYPKKELKKSIGVLCAVKPEVTLDGKAAKLEQLRDYATPFKDGLDGLFARTVENIIRTGRVCFLLEPDNQAESGGFHINEYKAEKFLRVKIAEQNGESWASMVILDTSSIDYDTTIWEDVYYPQITMLALDGNGAYYQAKFGAGGVIVGGYNEAGRHFPQDTQQERETIGSILAMVKQWDIANPDPAKCTELVYPDKFGKTLDRIPFTCVNTSDLHLTKYEHPPLYDLCQLCLHILNADCDHQQAIYLTTDPIPTFSGVDRQDQVEFGANKALFLPEGASFGFTCSSGAGLDQQERNLALMHEQAKVMGVSLAGTAGAENQSGVALETLRNEQTAALRVINNNIGKAIEEQLRWAGRWIGMSPAEIAENIKFTPSNDFADIKPTAAEVVTIASNRDKLEMTREETRQYVERSGIVNPRPWEEVQEELDQQAGEDAEQRLNSVAGAFGFGSDVEDTPEDDEAQQPPQKAQKPANNDDTDDETEKGAE